MKAAVTTRLWVKSDMVFVQFAGMGKLHLVQYFCGTSVQEHLGNDQWWYSKQSIALSVQAFQKTKTLQELFGVLRTNAEVFV
ncbi:hypothetical protein KDA_45810 [Dictyobacter alpinus]|uniref:Uncharacterized protein n=1 Tax=Dictyobacter alpinus TaxID=2014873 RepID=A0A402BCT4_9CHLR|nr:hypothetical protein KDA_45810 [Dictyobacter alpinus]